MLVKSIAVSDIMMPFDGNHVGEKQNKTVMEKVEQSLNMVSFAHFVFIWFLLPLGLRYIFKYVSHTSA